MKFLFDYGHGGMDPGATYKGRKESNDVLRLGQAVAKRLRAVGAVIDETRTKDNTLSLSARTKRENASKYDYFISFHRNAIAPEKAHGAEVFTYPTASDKAKKLAKQLQDALVGVGFKNRGVKTAGYYVLKYTKAPAVLLEIGFIDHSTDNKLFDGRFDEIVEAIVGVLRKLK